MQIEKLVREISIWYQIDGQKVQNLKLNRAYPYMGPPPMSGVALDSENHILRDEITHARVLAWGRFAKIIPMSNPWPRRGPLDHDSEWHHTQCTSIYSFSWLKCRFLNNLLSSYPNYALRCEIPPTGTGCMDLFATKWVISKITGWQLVEPASGYFQFFDFSQT